MAKKLFGNGLIESSRMILPEYRDAYLEQQERKLEREKPNLDPQELELIQRAIIDARNQRLKLRVTKFGPYEVEVFVGDGFNHLCSP
ncbi:YolD-like family protein [Paenibacillus hubeiensis]|uniref:YolD-like family protein n=1 Tax=Paenibacillus hubeiensis TaxID=3077330 RepID=UPI0031BBBCD3